MTEQVSDHPGGKKLPLILGLPTLTHSELEMELAQGGRLVFFEYCISFLLFTLRHPSPICLLRKGERAWIRALPYSLASLMLGWWGLPWGVIYTPLSLVLNCTGGRDVTAEIQEQVLAGKE